MTAKVLDKRQEINKKAPNSKIQKNYKKNK